MTYTAVARCTDTGQIGVATASHWPFTASTSIFAQPGVGVVATHGTTEPSYGPKGLALMDIGSTADATLNALLAEDAAPSVRQVAMMSQDASSAHWTGEDVVESKGSLERESAIFLGNLLANDDVVPAMAESWDTSKGEKLQWRLLGCLEAAQEAGGDVRGQQAAGMRVVTAERSHSWEGLVADIRIDDDPEPLVKLRHLLTVREAYHFAHEGDIAKTQERYDDALELYNDAQSLLPNSAEIAFWRALLLAHLNMRDATLQALAISYSHGDGWRELALRMQRRGRIPAEWSLEQVPS